MAKKDKEEQRKEQAALRQSEKEKKQKERERQNLLASRYTPTENGYVRSDSVGKESAPKAEVPQQITREEYIKRRQAGESADDIWADYDKRQSQINLATPSGMSQYSSFDELPFVEQYKISAALYGGSPSANQYVSNALKTYQMLEGEAKTIARESGIKPDNPRYQEFIDSYLDGMYNDNFISLDDIRGARTQMSNNNDETYNVSQQKADEARASQSANQYYIDPVTGAPIEDYGYGNSSRQPQVSAKDRFNNFMTTPNFNNWAQSWRDKPNSAPSGMPGAGDWPT